MLLGIYLGTTAFAWYSVFRFKKIMNQRLNDDGYKTVKKEIELKDIIIGIFTGIALCVPVLNLSFPFALTTKNEDYIAFKNKGLNEGTIIKIENNNQETPITLETQSNEEDLVRVAYLPNMKNTLELVRLVEENARKRQSMIQVDDSKLVQRTNKDGHIYYSPMNKEESNTEELSGHTYRKML